MGNVGTQTPQPDFFSGQLGERGRTRNTGDALAQMARDMTINPKYVDDLEQYYKYHKNCALCTTAGVLALMGYDVEAMPRDKDNWRGPVHVFEVDYSNPDNYIASTGATAFTGDPRVRTHKGWKAIRDKEGRLIRYEKEEFKELEYYNPKNNPSRTYLAKGTISGADITKVPKMPRGAKNAATAIADKVEGWGNGAFGQITVKWNTGGGHSMVIANVGGTPHIYDLQSGESYKGRQSLEKLLKSTTANTTTIVRLDNAKVFTDSLALKHMVKRRDKK